MPHCTPPSAEFPAIRRGRGKLVAVLATGTIWRVVVFGGADSDGTAFMVGRVLLAIFAAVGLAGSLIARGLWRALTAVVWALGVIARYLIRILWWVVRVGVPALGQGARALGRFVWPRLVIAVALLGYGTARAGTWVRRKLSRANESP